MGAQVYSLYSMQDLEDEGCSEPERVPFLSCLSPRPELLLAQREHVDAAQSA